MIRKLAFIGIAVLLLTGLCTGCGGQQTTETSADTASETTAEESQATAEDQSQYVGEYFFYGTYLNQKFVIIDALEGTSTRLDEDGTGYLNWGEGNSGPVSEWSVTENSIQILAGESDIRGLVHEGVMILYIGDSGSEFMECYVREDADTSDMPRITAEEWAEMISESLEAESD